MTIGDIAFLTNGGGFSSWIVDQLRDDLTKRLCFRVFPHASGTYKGFVFDDNCNLYPENSQSALGTSSSKWKDVYATTLHGELDGNSSTSTTLKTSRNLWGNSFDGSQDLSGNIEFTNNDITGTVVGVKGKVGTNDSWRVGGGATDTNAGFLEIASADDSNEPIYVRQYKGAFTTVTRTATLLDASGNTQFPGTVSATTFHGDVDFPITEAEVNEILGID